MLGADMSTARSSRRWAVLLAAVLLLLPPAAGTAWADDLYEIDLRLQYAGFDSAYSEAYDAADADGVRVLVDFVSRSETRATYEGEAREISRLIWLHLEGRVLAVDVAPLTTAPWADGELPPALSFTRQDLQQAHGLRVPGLDAADIDSVEDNALFALGLGGGLLLVVLGATVGITVAVMHARCRRAHPPPGWNGYGVQAQPAGPHAWSSAPGGWPPAPAPTAPPAAAAPDSTPGARPTAVDPPWRLPSGG